MLPQMMTATQVADLLAVTTRCLEEWRARGVGPTFRRLGGVGARPLIRYAKDDVSRWLVAQDVIASQRRQAPAAVAA